MYERTLSDKERKRKWMRRLQRWEQEEMPAYESVAKLLGKEQQLFWWLSKSLRYRFNSRHRFMKELTGE